MGTKIIVTYPSREVHLQREIRDPGIALAREEMRGHGRGSSPAALLTADRDLGARFAEQFGSESVRYVAKGEPLKDLVRECERLARDGTVLVIDSALGDDGAFFWELRRADVAGVTVALAQANGAPFALGLLREVLARLRSARGGHPPVVLVLENPPAALAFGVYRLGVDWIWPEREFGGQFGEVVEGLREGAAREEAPKPTVVIVENSRAVCLALRERLNGLVEPLFVGSDKAATDFSISGQEARAALEEAVRRGPVAAAIIDLALSREAEEQATEWRSEKNVARAVLNRLAGAKSWSSEVLSGVELVLWLREKSPTIPVFVFSSFLDAHVLAGLARMLGEAGAANVYPVEKSEAGYQSLRESLRRLTGTA